MSPFQQNELGSPRQMRISSTVRGVAMTVLLAAFGYFSKQPGASLSISLLIAAALQSLVLLVRRVVPPDYQPQAVYILEMCADGCTVLLFALGVFGGMFRTADTF